MVELCKGIVLCAGLPPCGIIGRAGVDRASVMGPQRGEKIGIAEDIGGVAQRAGKTWFSLEDPQRPQVSDDPTRWKLSLLETAICFTHVVQKCECKKPITFGRW